MQTLKVFRSSLLLRIGSDAGEQIEAEVVDISVPKDSIWENHFEDNEKMTTVTVIEDFDQIGLEKAEDIPKPQNTGPVPTENPKFQSSEQKKSHPDKKKKAFRYGTKAERQSDRKKTKLKKQKSGPKRK